MAFISDHFQYIAIFTLCGLIIGFAKTGVPGAGILAVPMVAMLYPDSRQSVGALLPLLIVGDIFAVRWYHRQANWKVLVSLLPWVSTGIVLTSLGTRYIDRDHHLWTLGFLVLFMALFELGRQLGLIKLDHVPHSTWFRILIALLAGFATMIGNAAGPLMGIYFLSIGFKKEEFMGTGAWYFLMLNCFKVPIYLYQKPAWINGETLMFDLKMVGLVIAGAFLGIWVHPKIKQKTFQTLVLFLAAAAALNLLASAWRKTHPGPVAAPASIVTPSADSGASPTLSARPTSVTPTP